MLRAYDFKCPEGHIFEKFVTDESIGQRCQCGLVAHRILSPVASILPANRGFPGKDISWIRDHEASGSKQRTP